MKQKKSVLSVLPRALIFAIIVGVATYFTSDKLGLSNYRAQSKILTTNKASVSEEDNLALAFAATIDSDAIKNKVLDNLDLDWQPADLDKKLTIVPIKGSPVINIIVEDPIKLRAEDLADEYADVSVELINDLYNGSTQVLEYSYNNAGLKSAKEKYALYFGGLAFLIWFLFGALFTGIHNRKIDEEIQANPNQIDESQIAENKGENPESKTRKRQVKTENKANNYQTLGKLPEYEEDDLNV